MELRFSPQVAEHGQHAAVVALVRRQAYRFLAPRLAQAGYRVASADLRGHGESSMGWKSVTGTDAISRTDVAGDLLALIRHLGGPAVIVGHSISGGAATIAAAMEPELVSGIVEINPFTRTQKLSLGGLVRIRRYRRGLSLLMGTLDPDFADPRAEGDAIVAAMPPGLGTVAMVNGAGHYPHAQCPDEVAALMMPFLKEHAGA